MWAFNTKKEYLKALMWDGVQNNERSCDLVVECGYMLKFKINTIQLVNDLEDLAASQDGSPSGKRVPPQLCVCLLVRW